MKSCLFVFEGPDGVGKSTLASHLNKRLNDAGFPTQSLSFPGQEKGTLGELLYRLYHHPETVGVGKMSIVAEQLLFTAAHADVIENRIIPTLAQGQNVVLDRYWWSTWVYATACGLDSRMLRLLIDLEFAVWGDLQPTSIFLVKRDHPAKFVDNPEKWKSLVSLYKTIRSEQAGNVKIIEVDNNERIESAIQFVWNSTVVVVPQAQAAHKKTPRAGKKSGRLSVGHG